MKKIRIIGYVFEVEEKELENDILTVQNGHVMIELTKNANGAFEPTNGVDGWGVNIQDELKGLKVRIE